MLASAEKRGSLRARAASLNHLAGWLRKNKQPVEGVQRALEEAIAIALKLGSFELEVLYAANLGNALRDQGNSEGAERHYAEAIRLARLHGLQRWEAYGMEMLGGLRTEQRQYEDALRLSTEALATHEIMGDQIRVATVLDNLGTIYRALDDCSKAADHEQRAAETFGRIGQHGQAADSYAPPIRARDAVGPRSLFVSPPIASRAMLAAVKACLLGVVVLSVSLAACKNSRARRSAGRVRCGGQPRHA